MPEIWANTGIAWCLLDAKLARRPDLDKKAGKDGEMWKMQLQSHKSPKSRLFSYDRVMPCKALVVIKFEEKFHSFNLSYETVSVKACPSVGGMVLMKVGEDVKTPDTSSLKDGLWHVTPYKCGIRFMLHLRKLTRFDANARKDDVTGEVYPYDVSAAYVIKKKVAPCSTVE